MGQAVLKVFIFLIVLICVYVYVGYTITDLTGGFEKKVVVEGINAEAGEQIFFGKGKCSTCHSISDKGSAIRCPNLGVKGDNFKVPIGERTLERAAKRSEMTGKKWRPVDYLFECIGDPPAFVVPGYKAEMPFTYKPPIGLVPDEIKAVLMFLRSQGGEELIKAEDILNPTGIAKEMFAKVEAAHAGGAQQAAPFKLYLPGDPENGKKLFWDTKSKVGCAKCHTVNGLGGKVGPELTSVAGTRTLPYVVESVLQPSAVIVSGYESFLLKTNSGQMLTGTKREDTDEYIVIGTATGELVKVMKSDIKKMKTSKKSDMPGNFAEILSVDELHDVLSYVRTFTGPGAASMPAAPEAPATAEAAPDGAAPAAEPAPAEEPAPASS